MVEGWCHPSLARSGVRLGDVMVLAEVISDSFTWVGLDEVPSHFGIIAEMKKVEEWYFAWCPIAWVGRQEVAGVGSSRCESVAVETETSVG